MQFIDIKKDKNQKELGVLQKQLCRQIFLFTIKKLYLFQYLLVNKHFFDNLNTEKN